MNHARGFWTETRSDWSAAFRLLPGRLIRHRRTALRLRALRRRGFRAVPLLIAVWASWMLGGVAAAADEAATVALTAALEKEQVVVTVGGKVFTCYRFAPTLKKPYLWPVVGPRSGKSVTVESVADNHPHHNSIWIGCDRVNGQNFWAPPDKLDNGQIRSLGPKLVQSEGKAVVFTDECLWQKPGAEPVIRDLRRIAVAAPSADLRLIDMDITLRMLTDVAVQKTNHSLFSVRVVPELSVTAGGTLVNAEGQKGEKATFGVASPWCDYSGTREGITEGVALFEHPGNRWFPCRWFTRDYGFMSPTPMFWPPDDKEHRFRKGQEVSLRYRVVVHAGDVAAAGIAGLFAQYAGDVGVARLNQALERLKRYEFGQSREPLMAVADLVRESQRSPQLRETIEERLAASLQTDATFDAKQFICEELSKIGSERSVPVLAELLTDEKLSNAARFALERNPSPQADEALRGALASLKGDLRIGVINSLAKRRDRNAVSALAELARGGDAPLASAAISALGQIGGRQAAKLLTDMPVADDLKALKADALLRCADQMDAAADLDAASAIYRQALSDGNIVQAHIAALEGLVRLEKEKALPSLLAFLKDEKPALQLAAAKFAAKMPGETATKSLAALLPSLPSHAQKALLASLSARGDKGASPAVAKLAESADTDVRVAALQALGLLGDASHVLLLAKAAAADDRVGKAADESLSLLTGDGADAAMVNGMKGAAPGVRVALIRSLAARKHAAVIPVLFDALKDSEPNVHKAACKALASLAGRDELPRLVALLAEAKSSGARRDLEQCLATASARIGDAAACAEPIAAALPKAKDDAKASLLAVLGRLNAPQSLAAIRSQLTSQNPAVKKAAIQALAEWPTADPMAQLLDLAKNEPNEVHQVLALRGFVKQVTLPAKRSVEETAGLLREAMGFAKRPDEKKAILAVLPSYPCEAALSLAESCLADQQVAAEAALAVRQLKRKEGHKFDFQPKGAPLMEGFVAVDRTMLYSDQRGYGWLQSPEAERDRKAGTSLTRDFLFDRASRTFRVKVPNGPHVVTVYLGDMTTGHDDMEVRAEGEVKVQKITNRPGEVKELSFDVAVKDGVLDIEFRDAGGQNPHWTCAGLIVGK